jgi:pimeloyl-ACP methyl ester carboxylesterase
VGETKDFPIPEGASAGDEISIQVPVPEGFREDAALGTEFTGPPLLAADDETKSMIGDLIGTGAGKKATSFGAPVCARDGGELVEVRPGRELNVVQYGVDSFDTTVFFLHGACARAGQWDAQMRNMGLEMRVVAYDALGCGGSAKPASWSAYSTPELLDDAAAVFEKYKSKRNVIVGHSFGSSLAIQLAARLEASAPGAVVGLALLGASDTKPAGAGWSDVVKAPFAAAEEGNYVWLGLLLAWALLVLVLSPLPLLLNAAVAAGAPLYLASLVLMRTFNLPTFVLKKMQPAMSAAFVERALSHNAEQKLRDECLADANANPMHMCQAFYRQMSWATEAQVQAFTGRVLLLTGWGDDITPPTNAAALKHMLLKTAEVIARTIPDAGHQVMQEQPAQVTREVEHFIKNCIIKSKQQEMASKESKKDK